MAKNALIVINFLSVFCLRGLECFWQSFYFILNTLLNRHYSDTLWFWKFLFADLGGWLKDLRKAKITSKPIQAASKEHPFKSYIIDTTISEEYVYSDINNKNGGKGTSQNCDKLCCAGNPFTLQKRTLTRTVRIEDINCNDEKVSMTLPEDANHPNKHYEIIKSARTHKNECGKLRDNNLSETMHMMVLDKQEPSKLDEKIDDSTQLKNLNLQTFAPSFVKGTKVNKRIEEGEQKVPIHTNPKYCPNEKSTKIMNTVSPYTDNCSLSSKLLSTSPSINKAKIPSPYAYWAPNTLSTTKNTSSKYPKNLNPYRVEPLLPKDNFNYMPNSIKDSSNAGPKLLEDLDEGLYYNSPLAQGNKYSHASQDYALLNNSTLNPYHTQSAYTGYGLTGKPFPKSRNTPSVISFKSTPPANYANYGGSDCGGYHDNYLKRHHIFNPRNMQRYTHYQTSGNALGLPLLLQQRNSHRSQTQNIRHDREEDKFLGLNMALNLPSTADDTEDLSDGLPSRRQSAEEDMVKELEDDRILRDLSSQLHILDQKLGISSKNEPLYAANMINRSMTPSSATLNSRRHKDLKTQVQLHSDSPQTLLDTQLLSQENSRLHKTNSSSEYDSACLTKGSFPVHQKLHHSRSIAQCPTSLPLGPNIINKNDVINAEDADNIFNVPSREPISNEFLLPTKHATNERRILTSATLSKYSPSYINGTPLRSSMDCNNAPAIYANGMIDYDVANGSMLSLFSNVSSIYSTPEEKQAHELRKLKRELDSAQEKVYTLTNQLSTNTHVVAAFEQSLINMTQRFQNLSATATAKDDELLQLRETIDALKKQSLNLQNKYPEQANNLATPVKVSIMPNESLTNQVSPVFASAKAKKKKNWLRSSFTKAFSRTKKTKCSGPNNSTNLKTPIDSNQSNHPPDKIINTLPKNSTETFSDIPSAKSIDTLNPVENAAKKSSNSVSSRSSYSFSSSSNDSHPTPRSSVISGNDSIAPLSHQQMDRRNQTCCPLVGIPSIQLNNVPEWVEEVDGKEIPTSRPTSLEKIDVTTLNNGDFASDENLLRFLSKSTPETIIKTLVERLREKNTKLTTFQLETLASHHRMTHMKETLKRMRKEMMDLKKDNDRLHKILTISAMHKDTTSAADKKGACQNDTNENHQTSSRKSYPITTKKGCVDNNLGDKLDGELELLSLTENAENDKALKCFDNNMADEEFEKNRNCAINYIDDLLNNLASYDNHDDSKLSKDENHVDQPNAGNMGPSNASNDLESQNIRISPFKCENVTIQSGGKNQKGVARISPSAKRSHSGTKLIKLKCQVCISRSSCCYYKGAYDANDEIPIGLLTFSEKTEWETLETCLKRLFREFINRLNHPFLTNDAERYSSANEGEEYMRLNDISYYAIDEYYPSYEPSQNFPKANSHNLNGNAEKNGRPKSEMGLTPEESLWFYKLDLCVMQNGTTLPIASASNVKCFDKTFTLPPKTSTSDNFIYTRPYDMLIKHQKEAKKTDTLPFLKISLSLKEALSNSLDLLSLKTMVPKQYLSRYTSYLNDSKNLIITGPIFSLKSFMAKSIGRFVIERDLSMSKSLLENLEASFECDNEIAVFDMKHKSIDDLKHYLIGLNETCQKKFYEPTYNPKDDCKDARDNGIDFETMNCIPKVILIDNLPAYNISCLSQTFSGLSLIGSSSKNSSVPYFIITANSIPNDNIDQKSFNRLSSQGNLLHFKFVTLNINEEPLNGMLSRFLNQRLIIDQTVAKFYESISDSLSLRPSNLADQNIIQSELGQIYLWVNKLWLKVNTILETYHSTEASMGPSYFIGCPLSLTQSQSWFHELWNRVLVPYLSKHIKQGSLMALKGESNMILPPSCWDDPTNWVVQSYPWQNIKGYDLNSLDNNSNHLKRLKYEDLFVPTNVITSETSKLENNIPLYKNGEVNNYFDFQIHPPRKLTPTLNFSESNPTSPMQLKAEDSDPLLNMLIRLKEAANYTGSTSQNNTEDSTSDISNKSLPLSPVNSLKSNKKNGLKSNLNSSQLKVVRD